MYTDYFGLKAPPFSISPDPRYLYLSEQHREALAHLVYGITTDSGFILLTGEVGTGKTTVCRCLLEQIPEKTNIAFILNPKVTVEELLAAICDEFRIPYPAGNLSIKVFVDAINVYLLGSYAQGHKAVVIIEEAQNLDAGVMEQLRLLTNLETDERKLLQIILIGQPELREILSRPELRQLSQRITARFHLGPLSPEDVSAYVRHRLSVAGAKRELFSTPAIDLLHRRSRGVPRLINIICDRALLGAYVQGKGFVDKETLIQAAREVLGTLDKGRSFLPRPRLAFLLALLICSLAAAFIFYYHAPQKQPLASMITSTEQNFPVQSPVLTAPRSELKLHEGLSSSESKKMAYQILFEKWGMPYNTAAGDVCKQVTSSSIGCIEETGSLNNLISYNRPAVLKLFSDQGREYFSTLTQVAGQHATLVVGSETFTVMMNEIEKRWYGDYVVFWKMPPEYKHPIRAGYRGKVVQWLDKQLASLNHRPERPRNQQYDNILMTEVKNFQVQHGLKPDSIVGPQTIVRINTVVGTKEPLLMKTGGP